MGILRRRTSKPSRSFKQTGKRDSQAPKSIVQPDVKRSGNQIHQTNYYRGQYSNRAPSSGYKYVVVTLAVSVVLAVSISISFTVGFEDGAKQVEKRWERYPLDSPTPEADPSQEGGPCPGFTFGLCDQARTQQTQMTTARYYLNRGDAEASIGNVDKAMRFFSWSVAIGRPVGAHASRNAATRLQFLNLTCDYDERSLARVGRDGASTPLGGQITTAQRQRALKSLAHYAGPISGRLNRPTREAIRSFQSSLWFDATGVMSAEQMVLAVCGAAEIGLDPASQNLLGSMYAVGLGTRQSTDKALQWFQVAARQGSADASWNLALLFGTQTTSSSILVCDADQNAERADEYLKEAYDAGHPAANDAVTRFGELTPQERWRQISAQLRTPEALARVGRGCNPNG